MSSNATRRASTLSISLTTELAAEVSARVESGMYTSASELIREALRLLLRSESQRGQFEGDDSQRRFAQASELSDLGLEMQAEKVRQSSPGLSPAEVRARLDELAMRRETGPGLRVAPERLRKLTLDE